MRPFAINKWTTAALAADTSTSKRSNLTAGVLLILPLTSLFMMLASLQTTGLSYVIGQIFGAVFFAQAFILLHEMGHRSFFRTDWLHDVFGHFFAIVSFIPYYNWRKIHGLHHKFTGWRDLDPTTEKTFASRLNPRQEKLINTCWRYAIPLFTVGYRLGIYWKAEKLKRHLPKRSYNKCLVAMFGYGLFYLVTIALWGSLYLSVLPALLISFVVTDHLTLSQHSHIDMPTSGGKRVSPIRFKDQDIFSRSLELPSAISYFLFFNFNLHEAHHVRPDAPCYHLHRVEVASHNKYKLIPWLRKVKKMKGVDFIFRSDPNRIGF